MKKPELLAPAGSFAAAWQAFEAGADGVYLGLSEFSARKAATNFSLEQLKRIRGLARQRGRRVYVTLNTIIREDEMPRVASLCAWLESLEVDGVIVQDLGVMALLTRGFPRLAVHASTQMAIHNDSGLRFAEEAGVRRVILSRELPLAQIKGLRARHPGIELEVFIHGALCYSFSGVCLSSWALTGRSGNRGDCAQICRSVFCPEQNREANPFSCRDLSLGTEVLKLAEIGIDSLKIEGRMKSPEYVFHVTRMYREILDKGSTLSEARLEELQKSAETTFSREKTTAYFTSSRGRNLLTAGYPGHRGILLGVVVQARGREIVTRLLSRLSLHDGIGYFLPAALDPVIFPVKELRRGSKSARFAQAGETVSIPVAADAPLPPMGTEIRLFSSRFLDRPLPKESGFPPFKIPINLEATLREANGTGVLACKAEGAAGPFNFSASLKLVKSTGGKSFEGILRKVLGESGSSFCTVAEPSFVNQTGWADTEIFVPPSELKKTRNEIYSRLDSWVLSGIQGRAQKALVLAARPPGAYPDPASLPSVELSEISHRSVLSPPSGAPVPFAALSAAPQWPAGLASHAGFVFVPLPPVMLDDDAWGEALRNLSKEKPETRFAVGLNNVGHLELAGRLADRENCFFFIDYFLYVANRIALSFLTERVRRLLFLYSWIEGGEEVLKLLAVSAIGAGTGAGSGSGPGPVVVTVAADHRPPLFYSLGCYERHALGGGRCRDDCQKDFTYQLRQGKNRFDAVVKDCVTYLFQTGKEPPHGRAS